MSTRYRPYYLRAVWACAALGALWVMSTVPLYPPMHDWRLHHDPICISKEWVPDFRPGSPTYGTPICKGPVRMP